MRQWMREQKRMLSQDERELQSRRVFNQIVQMDVFETSDCILLFNALPDELPTREFLDQWSASHELFLPVVVGNDLEIRKYEGVDRLIRSHHYGIMEPVGDCLEDWRRIDLAIIPGIAFDLAKNRLGRGKGYYDRFLRNTSAYKIGVGFNVQLVNELPVEPHDIPMDDVICG